MIVWVFVIVNIYLMNHAEAMKADKRGAVMSEIRFNPIDGTSVILAEERSGRPFKTFVDKDFKDTENHLNSDCPFCEGNEAKTPAEVYSLRDKGTQPDKKGWKVRVVPNKYPVLDAGEEAHILNTGLFSKGAGRGAHEVLIESPEHISSMAELSTEQIYYVLSTYRVRLDALLAQSDNIYVSIFKNHGAEAGASLPHSHSQIISTGFVPEKVKNRVRNLEDYYNSEKSCMVCDIIREEMSSDERILYISENFIVLMPYWAIMPFEALIIPRYHNHIYNSASDDELLDLAGSLKTYLLSLSSIAGDFPYNIMMNLPPLVRDDRTFGEILIKSFHWYIMIVPRSTKLAGFELLTGVNINTISPEYANTILKKEIKSII